MVLGIIVDTFSELRGEKDAIAENMRSECFICRFVITIKFRLQAILFILVFYSIRSDDFERFGNGFSDHIKKEHNMWNYLFYMMHVSNTNPSDYTAHEQYVAEMLDKEEFTSFFPINRSMALALAKESSVSNRVDAWILNGSEYSYWFLSFTLHS